MNFSSEAHAFVGAGADASLVTINDDGTPHASVVWVRLEPAADGGADEVVFGSSSSYQKIRNIQRDPRVALTVVAKDPPGAAPSRYLVVNGTATVEEGDAAGLLRELQAAMLAPSSAFTADAVPSGVIVRVRADRIGGRGGRGGWVRRHG